jgi:hypothetical protein
MIGLLALLTGGLRRGPIYLHWTLFGAVLFGAMQATCLSLLLGLIFLNLALWLAIAATLLGLLAGILMVLASAGRR